MENISKAFPGVQALDTVNFDLEAGEVHVLLGENGAGKSTLIKILSGAYQKDKGTIYLNGEPVEIHNPRRARELGVATTYQELDLIPYLSVAENIFLGNERLQKKLGLKVIDWSRTHSEVLRLFSDLGISLNPKAIVDHLSVSEQQLVTIAKALSGQVKILVLDEPTASLTDAEIKLLFSVVKKLKEQDVGIIYISHRLEEVSKIGDRVTVLRDGRRIGMVEVKESNVQSLIKMIVGRELADIFPSRKHEIKGEVLRVEGLSRQGILHGIDLHVRKGEILGIAGLVGSGRTEMARAIVGADPISSGKVFVDEKEVKFHSPNEAIRHGVALLPEDRRRDGLILPRSVRENITLASIRRFLRHGLLMVRRERNEVQKYVRQLDIRIPSLNSAVQNLSGGNKQKVVLAKWLCCQVKVLIFDEPTRGIDVGAKVEVHRLMNQLVEEGMGIIMISSELPEILGMCDRIIVMREGHVVSHLHRQEATQEKILSLAMLGVENV